MDNQLEAEIQKVVENAKPMLLELVERLTAVLADKYTQSVATESVRAILHGVVTGLELSQSKENVNVTQSTK